MLDTQVMLWWLLGDQRLRQETRELMATSACAVSVASVWEVAIKHRIGKLPIDPATFRDQTIAVGAALLTINDPRKSSWTVVRVRPAWCPARHNEAE